MNVDDLIGGLRVKKSTRFKTEDSFPSSDADTRPQTVKQAVGRLTPGAKRATVVGLILLACCCGNRWNAASSPLDSEVNYVQTQAEDIPSAAPTVTVTVTQKLPESCIQAIQSARDTLTAASKIASVNGRQLDIIDMAYQAILEGDTAKLNAAAEKQIALDLELGSVKAEALIPYQKTMDGLATCLG